MRTVNLDTTLRLHATASRVVSVVLAALLAVTMLPAAGLASAFADEVVERPATSGGDVALSSANGAATDAAAEVTPPVAQQREDGMLVADGLVYTVADGGLALVGFEGEAPEGSLVVPASVVADGKEAPVVAVALAEGHVADAVSLLSLPQTIANIDTASLAAALPSLASVEIASASSSALPVAAGAASVRAAYSTSGGMIFRPTSVDVQNEDGSVETIECKELLWAPPALVSARIPVECRAIAEGAFADAKALATVVTFGTMERIAEGAFTDEQFVTVKVVVPNESPAVVDEGTERVSASMALMNDEGQMERRRPWHEAGFASEDIVMGKPYGSLTETVAVTEEGAIESEEARLVSYPGMHPEAMDVKHPGEDGKIDMADNGLAFTVKSDMTASVTWQGDKIATPAHLDIPSVVVIDNVTYPVTEIAPRAFEGAVFLTSVTIPEGVVAIGQDAFKDCPNLTEPVLPSTLKETASTASVGASVPPSQRDESAINYPAQSQEDVVSIDTEAVTADESISTYATTSISHIVIDFDQNIAKNSTFSENNNIIINVINDRQITATVASGVVAYWGIRGTFSSLEIRGYAPAGNNVCHGGFSFPSGWTLGGISNLRHGDLSGGSDTAATDFFGVTVLRSEVKGSYPLLTTNSFEGSGTKTTAARSDHNHDATYAQKADLNNYVTNSTLTSKNYITKAVSELDNFYDKAKFNKVSYDGLEGATFTGAAPTFYVNDAAKLPSVPEPQRDGYAFLGWTWSGQSAPTKDASAAFSGGGAVTLTANWSEPETNHFFGPDAYDAAADGTRSHTIKVKIADKSTSSTAPTVTGVSLAPKADAPVRASATDKISFGVGATDAADAFATAWGASDKSSDITLADLGDGWGLYVRITVPAGALDEGSIVKSYTNGDYVASLVTLNYTLKSA